ncbi:MAG: hypothetical protein OEX75_05605 [Gammaproteobacteria bacterium]|nr:hypothetical protein [Gammaproteobacteria bacterium]
MSWFGFKWQRRQTNIFEPGRPGILASREAMIMCKIRQRVAQCESDKIELEPIRKEVAAEVDRLLNPLSRQRM